MQAIIQDTYGGPEVLTLREVDPPTPRAGEVLLRVRAAGVNLADWGVLRGEPYIIRLFSGLRRPRQRTGGTDVAGTVLAVGPGVTRFAPGDEVLGAGTGTFAEQAIAPERNLVPKPTNLGFEQAAAVPMAGLVALQGLRHQAGVQPGQHVLVSGAGGGIGTFAVQIAKALGAEVTGVCSPSKVDRVRAIGADHVIDYTREDFCQGEQRYDVVFDNAGHHPLSAFRRVLTRRGTLIPNYGAFENRWFASLGTVIGARLLSLFVRHRLRPFLSLPTTPDLLALGELLQSGKVIPVIDRAYPLAEAAQALAHVGAGHACGKVVITA